MKKSAGLLCFTVILFLGAHAIQNKSKYPQPLHFKDVSAHGELFSRAMKNFDRLESDIYTPENVFPLKHHVSSEGWPGDKEGRTILGLVMEAQATHREPVYLAEMIRIIPQKVNAKGYLGPLQGDTLNEQQLSGHGWFLRGLCEYYLWKKDAKVKQYIETIIQNLVLPTRGFHKNYPSNPSERRANVGAVGGTTQNVLNNWLLSSDVGCDFIFLDGVVQAYGILPSKELKSLVDEMIESFLNIDLVKIKAQTHATLTGLRALIRYYEITGDRRLIEEAAKRYQLYHELGMTENYENFNWFGRPEWTEPCAIVDSYMTAVQLWQYTGEPKYLEDAQHIYYNGICHTQRANGGFGCDNCPGPLDLSLMVKTQEAYWCCTMRGGEGLARAINYSYFTRGKDLFVTYFGNNTAAFTIDGKKYNIHQSSSYPFGIKSEIIITPQNGSKPFILKIFSPSWIINPRIMVNGKEAGFTLEKGFINMPLNPREKTRIELTYEMNAGIRTPINKNNTQPGVFAFEYGPLMLGYDGKEISFSSKPGIRQQDQNHWTVSDDNNSYEFTPVYHLMNEKVKDKMYQKQILFK